MIYIIEHMCIYIYIYIYVHRLLRCIICMYILRILYFIYIYIYIYMLYLICPRLTFHTFDASLISIRNVCVCTYVYIYMYIYIYVHNKRYNTYIYIYICIMIDTCDVLFVCNVYTCDMPEAHVPHLRRGRGRHEAWAALGSSGMWCLRMWV